MSVALAHTNRSKGDLDLATDFGNRDERVTETLWLGLNWPLGAKGKCSEKEKRRKLRQV